MQNRVLLENYYLSGDLERQPGQGFGIIAADKPELMTASNINLNSADPGPRRVRKRLLRFA